MKEIMLIGTSCLSELFVKNKITGFMALTLKVIKSKIKGLNVRLGFKLVCRFGLRSELGTRRYVNLRYD